MRIGQRYVMTCTTAELQAAKIGYPVFLDEDSDEVVGFISGVLKEECSLELCLFNPVEIIDDTIDVLDETLDPDDVTDMLIDIIEGDVELIGIWAEAETEEQSNVLH